MTGREAVRERIIAETTKLIEASEGNVEHLTAREIASRSSVALGLINYYFGNKESLITECVQRIITQVVMSFETGAEYPDDRSRLTAWASQVFAFLFEHKAICRISIIGDMRSFTPACNTTLSQRGFALAMRDIPDPADRMMLSLLLTSALQTAFLGRDLAGKLWGYDLSEESGRNAFIARLVDLLMTDHTGGRKPKDAGGKGGLE